MNKATISSTVSRSISRGIRRVAAFHTWLSRFADWIVVASLLAIPLAAWQAVHHGNAAKFGSDMLLPQSMEPFWLPLAYLFCAAVFINPVLWLISAVDGVAQVTGALLTGHIGKAFGLAAVTIALGFAYVGVFAVRRFLVGLLEFCCEPLIRALPQSGRERLQQRAPQTSRVNVQNQQVAASPQFPAKAPTVTFRDLHGMAIVKAKLLEAGRAALLQNGPHNTNGILLYGDPGNGKTVFGEALAGELGIRILSVSIADIKSRWIGQTTEQLVAVFHSAAAQAPCVLMVDEVDSIIRARETAQSEESGDVTNAFLTEVVRLRGQGVIVIAATNFLNRLDAAAIREGRFDHKIEIASPDREARLGLLRDVLRDGSVSASPEALEAVARRWAGFSVARLKAIGREASAGAHRATLSMVSADMLMQALRNVQARRTALPEDCPGLADLQLGKEQETELGSLAWRMSRPFDAEALGASVPDGVLFFGPQGTGKTRAVQALSRDTGWQLIAVSGQELAMQPQRINDVFSQAADARPAIIFIDEADPVVTNRRYGSYPESTNRLLVAMDGAMGKIPDVLVIAATNHPEQIDPAMLRGGRFTEKVEFRLPARNEIVHVINGWMADKGWTFGFEADRAADSLSGLSIADVKAVLQCAVNAEAVRIAQHRRVAPREISERALEIARATVCPGRAADAA